jgi:hypothetical protein
MQRNTASVHHVGGEKDGEQTWEMSFSTEMALAYLLEVADLNTKNRRASSSEYQVAMTHSHLSASMMYMY